MKRKIKLMLVEDSPAYRKVVDRTLKSEEDMELVCQFSSAEGALRSLQDLSTRQEPDLVLLDLHLPGMTGIEAIPHFLRSIPDTRIIVLTQSGREADVLAAIQSGANGYLLKSSTLNQMKAAIRDVIAGGATIDPAIAKFITQALQKRPPRQEPEFELSQREIEILTLTSEGLLKKEIAAKLGISHRTVATHIEHIYQKLNVQNAPAAIHKAHRAGLFRHDN
ncbi:response regulator [Pontiella sp.]|uniref:response regulator n=1 Tax=Pontiella sp. TaxID=2837462 RepID=UPI003568DE96